MSYNDRKIKVDASLRELNKKIKNNIENTEEKIYWYIKFSLPLDESSVSKKTMTVTDISGYIFGTDIIYNKKLELIIIEPLDFYKEEEYYILHIKKDVRSENLQNLKNDVHILFKIKGGQVIEFKELGQNILVPKPKRRPTKSKVYAFQRNGNNILEDLEGDKLPFIGVKINPIGAILGMPLFLVGVFLNNNIVIGLGGIVSLLGFFHILIQIMKKEFRSNFYYNLGALRFNKGKFNKAQKYLKKSVNLNCKNEFAEYGVSKVSYFID